MNEIKTVVAMTVRRFHISLDEDNPPKWASYITLRSLTGMHLRFKSIDSSENR